MRTIGHIKGESGARLFSDYLYSRSIKNEVDLDSNGAWAVWILDEDQLERAREMMAEFESNSADPKFESARKEARERRANEAIQEKEARKRIRDSSDLFPEGASGVGQLTLALIGVCSVISLLMLLGWEHTIVRALFISYYVEPVLPEVRHGEVWRLVTPILVHGGVLHLLFNMLMLLRLGTLIERRQGTIQLSLLVLVIAVLSNLAQYFRSGPDFCGMSGVVYGLIGYVWLRGKFDPASGLFLESSAILMAVVWYFLCLLGYVPHVANTVHTVGFGVGLAWGYLSAEIKTRRLR